MDIINRTVIKKWSNSQTNLIIDSEGDKFIEKIQFYNPITNNFNLAPYDSNEYEIYRSIIIPLEIPHVQIIGSAQTEKSVTFVMDFIDGIVCEDAPKAEHLYMAAEKAGTIYKKSKENMSCADKDIIEKYKLSKEKIIDHTEKINKRFNMPPINLTIDYIYEKYKSRTIFVNHFDMHFKNFILNDDLHLIDWASMRISPFFTDLYLLLSQADEVGADADEIKKRYLSFAQINHIDDEDIYIGGIIWNIVIIRELLDLVSIDNFPIEWAEDHYNDLQNLLKLLNFH